MDEQQKQYTGSVYIGVVGSENENDECRDTIEGMTRRDGDTRPHYVRATKGYEARQMHLNKWYDDNEHPFILFLDRDMAFPEDALERLRSWGLPFVSGLYMRRRYNPMAPVWFEYGQPGVMPLVPYTGIPLPNTLYKIGASGWGCVLMHRDVVTAVRGLLKGERDIIEDDMDVYPYDLPRIMKAINSMWGMMSQDKALDRKEIRKHLAVLKREIRPLRGLKDIVGSDIRFPFYARLAGFDMYGDSGVMCGHMLHYPLTPSDYISQPAANVRDVTFAIQRDATRERESIQKALAEL